MPALSTGGKRKKTRERTASLPPSNRSELAAIKVRRAHELFTAIDGCSSWEEIHRAWSDYSAKQKGDLFEELVRAFLQIEPEYASKLKNVWLHNEVPQAILKQLKLPETDQGIDLIAQTNEGEFWAIQCKYRQATETSVTWRDVSTFTGLAFGVCKGISFGMICSTTERITRVLKHQDRIGFCALDVWQGLDVNFFSRLRAHLKHKPEVLKPAKPRPHQREAIKAGHKYFVTEKAKRGKLIMPCGSGKSLAAYWIAESLGARNIVIAVPSLALIRQTLKVWLRETSANKQPVEWICVCSDESAGRVDNDDVSVLRQDLGVPCLTDSSEIAHWLQRKHHGLTVVFTTYQSGEALSKAARKCKFRFDLGIMDEAHKTVGDSDKLFSHLLHDKNLPIRRRIFMTATERRYRGQSDTVLSMDNPAVYGETFHVLSFKRALEYQPPILSDYKIISMFVSRSEVAELIRNNNFVKPDQGKWNKDIEADMLASLVTLRKAMIKYPIKHAVSFHSSIARAELFKTNNDVLSKATRKFGLLETFHVSGKTPTGTRARIIGEFADAERALVTNARCLTEGVDVPGIDCVLFADPRRSAVDIVQAVGRALRPAPGKKFGYVIVPILQEDGATGQDILESKAFEEVLTTLRALAANDDRIIEYFRGVAQGRKPKGRGKVRIEFDFDERLAKSIDLNQFVNDIELKTWDRLAKLSWRPFEEAREFVRGLGLKSQAEWGEYRTGEMPELERLPADIPTNPNRSYLGKGWKGIGDWIGTRSIKPGTIEYRPFEQARKFVRALQLKKSSEWRAFCGNQLHKKGHLPFDIPSNPNRIYNDSGWKGMGDWLGTGFIATFARKYRSFSEARDYVHSLKITRGVDWVSYCRLGRLPVDIPANPNQVYAHNGWNGIGDWLGTGNIGNAQRTFRKFDLAKNFARKLKLKNAKQWKNYCINNKLPIDIPTNPSRTYADEGWTGFGDWLGTGLVSTRSRQYRRFEDARAFVHNLNFTSGAEWNAYCQGKLPLSGNLPMDIPARPANVYPNEGWVGMGDWLGTGNVSNRLKTFRTFVAARAFVRTLNLKGENEWRAYCRKKLPHLGNRPADIPAAPSCSYVETGWKGWGDWLGTGRSATRDRRYRSFLSAREFAHKLKLKSTTEWRAYCKGEVLGFEILPSDIPRNPNTTYAEKGWKGMGDWLGTGINSPRLMGYLSFQSAQAFAHKLKLCSAKEWFAYCNGERPDRLKLPAGIPKRPNQTYANKGWTSWGDWLGTGRTADRLKVYRPFRAARAFVRRLSLNKQADWFAYCHGAFPKLAKKPADIPTKPFRTYVGKGWKGMGDWLGNNRPLRKKPKSRV